MADDKKQEVKKPDDAKPETKMPDELSEADLERTSGGHACQKYTCADNSYYED
jgi:hypothetical protein